MLATLATTLMQHDLIPASAHGLVYWFIKIICVAIACAILWALASKLPIQNAVIKNWVMYIVLVVGGIILILFLLQLAGVN